MRRFVKYSIASIMCTLSLCSCGRKTSEGPVIGIAWCGDTTSNSYINTQNALKAAGIQCVMLDQVVSTDIPYESGLVPEECLDENLILKQEYATAVRTDSYRKSNVQDVMEGIDGVIFTGGGDISPTLFKVPEPWHGLEDDKTYGATRDVSDYILMDYCIAKDIPVLGICRGSQVLGVVSGATMIQDLTTWFEDQGISYDDSHRAVIDGKRSFASHGVDIKKGSLLYELVKTERLEGCPSWHHQVVDDVTGTCLEIVGTETTCGKTIVEAQQRTDCKFVLGIQFHPEGVFGSAIEEAPEEFKFFDKATAIELFQRFASYCK